MIYAIKDSAGNIIFERGQEVPAGAAWPVGNFINTPTNLLFLENSKLRLKTEEELRIENLPPKYKTDGGLNSYGNQIWIEKTQEEKDAIDASEISAESEKTEVEMANWKASKPIEIKYLETVYIDFLANMWTPALRAIGFITPDYTITVQNTTAAQNMQYLLQMRATDYPTYDKMSSEFLRLKTIIEEQTLKIIGMPPNGTTIMENVADI